MVKISHILILAVVLAFAVSDLTVVNPVCIVCHDMVRLLQHSVPRRPAEQVLDIIGTTYCTKKHLQNHNVCKGAVTEMMDSIVNSLWRHYTDPHAVCHNLRMCPKEYKIRNLDEDIKAILAGKPDKEWEQPTQKKLLKVMHISDLHPDLFYTVGAPAKCSEPVCCRSNVTLKMDPREAFRRVINGEVFETNEAVGDNPAGYYGSLFKCDLPVQTFDLFLKEVSKLDLDLILWTGDNTPHDIWQQTQSYNLNFTVMISEKLKRVTKAKVIAAMGNH